MGGGVESAEKKRGEGSKYQKERESSLCFGLIPQSVEKNQLSISVLRLNFVAFNDSWLNL